MQDTDIPTEMVLTLRSPVTFAKVEHTQLRLTEPIGKHLAAADKAGRAGGSMDQLITLIHLNAAVPREVPELMTHRDLMVAADFFGRFNDASPPTPSSDDSSQS